MTASLVAVGCSFRASYDDTRYRCGAGDACPTGQACVAGVCSTLGPGVADAGDPDSAPVIPAVDANPQDPDAAVGASVCGSLTLLVDDFSGGTAGPSWNAFTSGAPTATEAGGRLVVRVPAGTLGDGAGYQSFYAYDFTGGQLDANVSQVGGVTTSIEVDGKNGVHAMMRVTAGILYAWIDGGSNPGARAQLAYDPTMHRHWRIREAQGNTYWEWSSDGATWNQLWRQANPFPLDHVTAQLGASGELQSPSEAHFDDVNLDAGPVLGYCASSTLKDDFASGSLAPAFRAWNDGPCSAVESGGQVVLTFPGTGDVYCGIEATNLYDAVGSTLFADAAGVSPAASFVSFFQLVAPGDGGTRVEFDREAGSLEFRVYGNNVLSSQKTITYDATNHRYWRFRVDTTTVHWETSPDAVTWTERNSKPAPFDLSAVHIVLGAGSYSPGPGSQAQTTYRGVDVP